MRIIIRSLKLILFPIVAAIIPIIALLLTPLFAQETATTTPGGTATNPGITTSDGVTIGGTGGSTAEQYLYYIMQNTYGILLMVNNLPIYMTNLSNMATSWMSPDQTENTSNLQSNLANYANAILTESNTQKLVQPTILRDLFRGANANQMPYANDLAFQTLLGMPYFSRDPRQGRRTVPPRPPVNPPYNYLKNASGINIMHYQPSPRFTGPQDAQRRYIGFYNTVMSAESFNAYALSALYADFINGNPFTTLQNDLITQASGSDWFAQVASEEIGVVLRQILMYESQLFILTTQLLQLQKQSMAAQALTNSLLILNANTEEQTLLQKAAGNPPGTST